MLKIQLIQKILKFKENQYTKNQLKKMKKKQLLFVLDALTILLEKISKGA